MAQISIDIDQARDLMTFTVRGNVSAPEVIQEIKAHYGKGAPSLILWDFSPGSLSKISTVGFIEIAHEALSFASHRRGGKTAFVGANALDFGLSRTYQSFAELSKNTAHYAVFTTTEDAVKWLTAPPGNS